MNEPVTISVPVGEPGQDGYQGGNMLNAIDHVICYYRNKSGISDEQIADLLQVYAKGFVK